MSAEYRQELADAIASGRLKMPTHPTQDGHQAMRVVCRAAGWEFCEEHKRANRYTPDGCAALHRPVDPEHEYWCDAPDRDCVCPGHVRLGCEVCVSESYGPRGYGWLWSQRDTRWVRCPNCNNGLELPA